MVRFIKFVDNGDDTVNWLNPDWIVAIEENEGNSDVYYSTGGELLCLEVDHPPEYHIHRMNGGCWSYEEWVKNKDNPPKPPAF